MPESYGDAALAEFRAGFTGRRGLDLHNLLGGRMLVQVPVGVGKSHLMDEITLAAVGGGDYDLVIVLCPTRRLIDERGPLRDRSHGLPVVNLRPRPALRCGRSRDAQWRWYEAADLGVLGRREICGACPHLPRCYWPRQYGKRLKKAKIIYAAQVHLQRSPTFLIRLQSWAGARRVLTLLDESNFIGAALDRGLRAADLGRFAATLGEAARLCETPSWRHRDWIDTVDMLRSASTADLQDGKWRVPIPNPQWAAVVRSAGVKRFGEAARFLPYDLAIFGRSAPESRAREDNGDVRFSARPALGDCIIVFSATADPAFAAYRLGMRLDSPFADYRFRHPGTRWYNIASSIGTRGYFARHAPPVLDFFGELVARRTAEGKRVLLIAKKCFIKMCAEQLRQRWQARSLDLKPLTAGWTAPALADPQVVPLINYGMIGTNLFEYFDAVYCLTGYYVNEAVVDRCLQDVTRQDLRLPIAIAIETTGVPRRRRARVVDPDHHYYDVAKLVRPALEFQEHNVVVQAVGRVRPFTREREVITFQMGELPGVTYDAEFTNLTAARRFFGIPSAQEQRGTDRARQIQALRQAGLTQSQTAAQLGVSEKTVRNYERKEDRKGAI